MPPKDIGIVSLPTILKDKEAIVIEVNCNNDKYTFSDMKTLLCEYLVYNVIWEDTLIMSNGMIFKCQLKSDSCQECVGNLSFSKEEVKAIYKKYASAQYFEATEYILSNFSKEDILILDTYVNRMKQENTMIKANSFLHLFDLWNRLETIDKNPNLYFYFIATHRLICQKSEYDYVKNLSSKLEKLILIFDPQFNL